MYVKVIVSLTLLKIIDAYYLQAESNFLKPQLERKNIVNKGIWVRNKQEENDKTDKGNFIFRPNTPDTDNTANTFETFGQDGMLAAPFVSSYVQRIRRSPDHIRKSRPRKSMKTGKILRSSIEDSVMIKSKLITDLKPSSLFNEYPYEVAILLNDESETTNIGEVKELNNNLKSKNKSEQKNDTAYIGKGESIKVEELKIIPLNSTEDIVTDVPTRSKKFDYNSEKVGDFDIVKSYNKTEYVTDSNKNEREITKENQSHKVWQHSSTANDNNFYKVLPKGSEKSKTVTERGLIKLLLMLTKTFKKIMKQHSEIKSIHDNLLEVNKNMDQKIVEITSKFEDFDSKYSDMIQFNNKLSDFENELKSQKEYFMSKQKEIQHSLTEFKEHQKKFLVQQKQFYSIQKLMLAQNEKINEKQNLIAQTQSQIAHRQNNFARILKKAKHIMSLSQNQVKENNNSVKQENKSTVKLESTVLPLTTTATPNQETMKINLFAIPTKNKLENQDAQLIKEKDEKQIDDLVYKYYFNNTFIDSLIKSKILNNFPSSNGVEIVNRSKLTINKRDEIETTLMLPVNNSLSDTPVRRERRWINHFSKNKYRRLNKQQKGTTTVPNNIKDDNNQPDFEVTEKHQVVNEVKHLDSKKDDPFSTMAANFCNQIGQNDNEQALKWCIEKAMRRLKFMELNSFTTAPVTVMVKQEPYGIPPTPNFNNKPKRNEEITTLKLVQPATKQFDALSSTTLEPVSNVTPMFIISTPSQAMFFPDNDELESNLKQYELKPDTEGNVYYAGSVHVSDYGSMFAESEPAASDFMPGFKESDSRVQIDPMTFDLQAKRRKYVTRLNDRIMKKMLKKKA